VRRCRDDGGDVGKRTGMGGYGIVEMQEKASSGGRAVIAGSMGYTVRDRNAPFSVFGV